MIVQCLKNAVVWYRRYNRPKDKKFIVDIDLYQYFYSNVIDY